jgi:hypothetical protein
MKHFFTKRHLELAGVRVEEPQVPPPNLPPQCCERAVATRCFCEAGTWACPDHGTRGQPCNPKLSHD